MTTEIHEFRLTTVERAVKEISESLRRLVALEERHAETREGLVRINTRIDDHEDRIRVVEGELPTMRLTRQWVIAGVVGVWGVLASVAIGVTVYFVKHSAGL